MRYYAVLAYDADECSPLYSSFRLPAQLVPKPVNETASQNCKKYIQTELERWTVLEDGGAGIPIEPI